MFNDIYKYLHGIYTCIYKCNLIFVRARTLVFRCQKQMRLLFYPRTPTWESARKWWKPMSRQHERSPWVENSMGCPMLYCKMCIFVFVVLEPRERHTIKISEKEKNLLNSYSNTHTHACVILSISNTLSSVDNPLY